MLNHPTLDLLHELGLHGMAEGFKALEQNAEARALEHAEWLGLLLLSAVSAVDAQHKMMTMMILTPISGVTRILNTNDRLNTTAHCPRQLQLRPQAGRFAE